MLFNSIEFIFLFLPIAFVVYFVLNHIKQHRAAQVFLVLASLFFYSWWNVLYLPLIVGSMLFNFWAGNKLRINSPGEDKDKRKLLVIAVIANLTLLGYFKYTDFFLENINWLFHSKIDLLNLALPLAISFFTFQQIAYLVDSYRGQTKENKFLNYAVFVTFFPQLIAGPIVHHKEMMPQFSDLDKKKIHFDNLLRGLFIFSIGLFKKVIIADSFAVWATAGYEQAADLNIYEAWATSWSYTFQLYFDFSGYTDMAIGIALMFNIVLPLNFNSPYQATDIQDFWRRWHMTLSRFLRDYVYIPLGGNRSGLVLTYRNLLATFVLGGIWHGAGWTFVFWGFLHGFALCIHRVWSHLGLRLWSWLSWLITINFVNLAWVFFRAESWADATNIINAMFGLKEHENYKFSIQFIDTISRWFNHSFYETLPYVFKVPKVPEQSLFACLIGLVLVVVLKNNNQYIMNRPINTWMVVMAALAFGVAIIKSMVATTEVFLYFNF